MKQHYVCLSLTMFLVAALICLNPGGFHCEQAGTCQLLTGVTAMLSVIWTGATIALVSRRTRQVHSLLAAGTSRLTAHQRRHVPIHSLTSSQLYTRVFLL